MKMAFSTTNHIACNDMYPFIIQRPRNNAKNKITYIFKQQQLAQHVIALSHRYELGGIFISLISIKNFPTYPIIIIYNLLTNRWLKYDII